MAVRGIFGKNNYFCRAKIIKKVLTGEEQTAFIR